MLFPKQPFSIPVFYLHCYFGYFSNFGSAGFIIYFAFFSRFSNSAARARVIFVTSRSAAPVVFPSAFVLAACAAAFRQSIQPSCSFFNPSRSDGERRARSAL